MAKIKTERLLECLIADVGDYQGLLLDARTIYQTAQEKGRLTWEHLNFVEAAERKLREIEKEIMSKKEQLQKESLLANIL